MNQQRDSNVQHFYLRPLTVSDVEHISVWYEDIKDLSLIESKLSVPLNARSLQKIWQNDLEHSEPSTNYLFSIRDEDDDPIGHTGIQDISYANGNGVIFIYMRKDRRRCGVALRSMGLMLDLAFFQLRLHRITTYVHTDNIGSAGLVKRLGFINEGCMREGYFYDGEYGDVNIVGLLSNEWSAARGPLSEALDKKVDVAFGRGSGTRWIWPLS
ncbi:MAG: GNAT family N-acetyltransferase [Gammaproteobacteria bacterium]|nr:MAG: N-acetyltransferase [Gammaproteobacteria bacterium]UCH38717.1 MAG: GNAT family N-acetyltransferase [Gammaproteobacteria bacterium]